MPESASVQEQTPAFVGAEATACPTRAPRARACQMGARFESLRSEHRRAAAELAAERLGEPAALDRIDNCDVAVVCLCDAELVGLCYGRRRDRVELALEGIAIAYEHAGSGLGGRLLAAFEGHVRAGGYRRISLGSADGYVESLYLSHGYEQTEYMIELASGDLDLDLTGLAVLRCRRHNGQVTLNVAADGYSAATRRALVERLGASRIVCIFTKELR